VAAWQNEEIENKSNMIDKDKKINFFDLEITILIKFI